MYNPSPHSTAGPGGGGATEVVRPAFVHEGTSLFWLALGQAALTVLTLGIYRFWMITRLRRHYWSAIRVLGDPFEYTGTGLEKLVGFLVAVIILAVYLSLVNLSLVFAGLYSTDDVVGLQIALNLSVLVSLPLIYFATYRAVRYMMARTRWRGIRFGMEQAAWGYAGRAVLLSLLTAVTLGALYPLQHFRLTKFMTERTWFGDLKFEQGGRWTGLIGYWAWVYLSILVMAGALAAILMFPEDPVVAGGAALIVSFGYLGVFVAMLRYRVAAFRYLWANRTLGDARFRNDVDTGEVIGITIAGSAGVGLAAFFVAFLAMMMGAIAWITLVGLDGMEQIAAQMEEQKAGSQAAWPILVIVALGYLSAIPAAIAFTQIFLTRPILRRQAVGMQIANVAALAMARQREHDHALEAGGFADALGVDIGSGF